LYSSESRGVVVVDHTLSQKRTVSRPRRSDQCSVGIIEPKRSAVSSPQPHTYFDIVGKAKPIGSARNRHGFHRSIRHEP